MTVTDLMLVQWSRKGWLTFEFLDTLRRNGYFDGLQPEQIERHLVLLERAAKE